MRVELLAPHYFDGWVHPTKWIGDLPKGMRVTSLMRGLDDEAVEAVALECARVWPDGIRRVNPVVRPVINSQLEPPR